MSPIPLGIFAVAGAGGAGVAPYWIGKWSTGTSKSARVSGIDFDTSGNFFINATYAQYGSNSQDRGIYQKYNGQTLANAWNKSLAPVQGDNANYFIRNYDCHVNTSGNPIFISANYNSSGSPEAPLVSVRNSSDGSVIASKTSLTNIRAGYYSDYNKVSGYLHLCGEFYNIGPNFHQINGDLSGSPWGYSNENSSGSAWGMVQSKTSGDVYGVGRRSNTEGLVVKYQQNGTRLWQRYISNWTAYNPTLDADDNIFFGTDYTDLRLQKMTASGSSDSTRTCSGFGVGYSYSKMATGPDGNIVVAGYGTSGVSGKMVLMKFSPTWTIIWSRELQIPSSTQANVRSLKIDANNDIYIAGHYNTSTVQQGFAARLPGDGSLTQTLSLGGQNWVYATSTATLTTGTQLTWNSYSYNWQTYALSLSNYTPIDSGAALTTTTGTL